MRPDRSAYRQFKAITFNHIPREANRLADALANEALVEETQRRKRSKKQ
jgi:hypothetical protein